MKSISYLKISISIILIALFTTIAFFSKKYFEKHYNNEQIIESNLKLYKVKNQTELQENILAEQKLIEQNSIEVTTNEIAVINDIPNETLTETKNNTQTNNQEPKIELHAIKQEKESKTELITKKIPVITPKIENSSPNNKKNTIITKPKVLEKKDSLTKSVLKNPLFQGYIIQVGAFTEQKDAQVYKSVISQNKLIKQYSIEIRKSTTNLHQVIIGYFENSDTARNLCNKLKQENVQCFVTKI